MMQRVIVADDEPVARARLVRLLQGTGRAEIVAECSGGEATVAQTLALRPDVLFLDVQMPDLDGFGVVAELANRVSPRIVFVTAFDQYAVKAFEVHAFDYLLKPYTTHRFREAFERTELDSRAVFTDGGRLQRLVQDYLTSATSSAPSASFIDRVAIKSDGTLKIVQVKDVDWWQTDGNYMRIFMGGRNHLVRMTAAALESQLDPAQFARIHRRYIVNVERIVEIQPWFAGDAVVFLRNGVKLRLSRTYRARVYARLFGSADA